MRPAAHTLNRWVHVLPSERRRYKKPADRIVAAMKDNSTELKRIAILATQKVANDMVVRFAEKLGVGVDGATIEWLAHRSALQEKLKNAGCKKPQETVGNVISLGYQLHVLLSDQTGHQSPLMRYADEPKVTFGHWLAIAQIAKYSDWPEPFRLAPRKRVDIYGSQFGPPVLRDPKAKDYDISPARYFQLLTGLLIRTEELVELVIETRPKPHELLASYSTSLLTSDIPDDFPNLYVDAFACAREQFGEPDRDWLMGLPRYGERLVPLMSYRVVERKSFSGNKGNQ